MSLYCLASSLLENSKKSRLLTIGKHGIGHPILFALCTSPPNFANCVSRHPLLTPVNIQTAKMEKEEDDNDDDYDYDDDDNDDHNDDHNDDNDDDDDDDDRCNSCSRLNKSCRLQRLPVVAGHVSAEQTSKICTNVFKGLK